MVKGICNLVFDIIWICVVFGLTGSNHDAGMDCSEEMVVWLYVFGGICCASLFFDILYIFAVGVMRGSKKCKFFIDLAVLCILWNFEAAWLIYGNLVVYTDKSEDPDKDYGAY